MARSAILDKLYYDKVDYAYSAYSKVSFTAGLRSPTPCDIKSILDKEISIRLFASSLYIETGTYLSCTTLAPNRPDGSLDIFTDWRNWMVHSIEKLLNNSVSNIHVRRDNTAAFRHSKEDVDSVRLFWRYFQGGLEAARGNAVLDLRLELGSNKVQAERSRYST